MAPSLERRSWRWLRFSALLAVAIALLSLSVTYSRRLMRQLRATSLYSFDHGVWKLVAPVPARPIDLGAFSDGSLWAATEDGVLRFDGHAWARCPEALPAGRPAALAANAAGVWVLGFDGILTHFDGHRWTAEPLTGKLPGVTWGAVASEPAALAAGSGGTLWILRDGLWHYADNRWTEVRPGGHEVIGARLLGVSEGAAWLALDGEIQAVAPSGAIESRLSTNSALIAGSAVYRAIGPPGNLLLVTSSGLAVHDGTAWRSLAGPAGSGGVLDAARGLDGGIFAIGAQPVAGVQARLTMALPLLLLYGSDAALLAYLVYSFLRRNRGTEDRPSSAGSRRDPRNGRATRRTREALNEGDYREAMTRLQSLSFGLPSRHMMLLQTVVLALGGLPEEAEAICRRALGTGTAKADRFALDCLAGVLMDLGRFDEARKCLAEAIALDSEFDLACIDWAELLLLEGGDPERALEFVDRAAAAPPSAAIHCVGRQTDAEIFAVRGWALAAMGKRKDAEVSVQRALNCVDQKCRPVVAGVYWRIGRALETAGERNAAMTHLRNAAMLDPQGKYGNLACKEVAAQSAPSVTA
jgi:tetratricopeptide (TPR) repeat protein